MRRALAVALVAAGCSSGRIEVQLRVPAGDHPLTGADRVAVSLRDAGGQLVAYSRAAASANEVRLPAVPAAKGYAVEVDGEFGSDVLARGRSCSFDVDAAHPPTVPVWFSRVGRFAPTAAPATARSGANAFAWNGGALLAGGSDGTAATASTERYDVASASFAAGPMLSTPRAGAVAVDLDGTELLVGGAADGAPALEVLTPSSDTPEPAGLPPTLVGHAAARLGDGRVLIAGGRDAGGVTADAWMATQGGANVEPASSLLHARAGLTLTAATSDRFAPVFAIGGADDVGPVAAIEELDPATGAWNDTGAHLAVPRSRHTTTALPSGLLLVVGGVDAAGAPVAAAEIFDPVTRTVRPAGALHQARADHAATLLPSGRVLVTGGVDGNGAPLDSAELFDPTLGVEGDFVPTAPLSSPRAGHALVPLCDGTFLVAGGGAGAEIYNPF